VRVSFPNSSCCTPSFSEVSFDWPRRLRTVQRLRMDVAGDGTWSELVAKSFKFALGDRVSSTRDWYYREVESQVVAARLAEEFNARKPPKTVAFILPSVIELVHREGRPLCKKPDFFGFFFFFVLPGLAKQSMSSRCSRGTTRSTTTMRAGSISRRRCPSSGTPRRPSRTSAGSAAASAAAYATSRESETCTQTRRCTRLMVIRNRTFLLQAKFFKFERLFSRQDEDSGRVTAAEWASIASSVPIAATCAPTNAL